MRKGGLNGEAYSFILGRFFGTSSRRIVTLIDEALAQ